MAQAVAVHGGRILAVGTDQEILAYQGPETRIIDAGGASVVPGFIDAHQHFLMYGLLDRGILNVAHPGVRSIVELLDGLMNADRIMAENGIPSVHDAGSYNAQATAEIQDACRKGLIHTRIRPMIFDMFGKESGKAYIRSFIATGIHSGCGDDHFRIGHTKIMLDGRPSGPSCAAIQGYSHDPENHGIQAWQQEKADEIILEARRAGFQVTAHAVDDKAVTIMLNAMRRPRRHSPVRTAAIALSTAASLIQRPLSALRSWVWCRYPTPPLSPSTAATTTVTTATG